MTATVTARPPSPDGSPAPLGSPSASTATTAAVPVRLFRTDIQGLRAVAVVLVMLYHARVPGFTGGYVGVDVFFVISGFLITGQLLREVERTGGLSLLDFWTRRIKRLLPVAFVVLTATVVVARLWGPPLQVRTTAVDAVYAAFYAINIHLGAQGVSYEQADTSASPLQHFWSLAVEEQFYLVWPVLVLGAALVLARHARWIVGAVGVIGVGASFVLAVTYTRFDAPVAFFSSFTRGWEFGAGAVIACASPLWSRLPSPLTGTMSVLGSWTGLVLIATAAARYGAMTPFPGAAAVLPVIGSALVIVAGLPRSRDRAAPAAGARALLDLRGMQALGALSYSWYLWHWPMLVLMPQILGRRFSVMENVEVIVLALWLAAVCFLVLESPARIDARRHSRRFWATVGAAGSAVVVATCLAAVLIRPGTAATGDLAPPLALPAWTGGTTSAARAQSSADQAALIAALDTAAANPALPRNLTPALTAAATDVPPSSRNGCHADYLVVAQGSCVSATLTAPASRTAVVFGDSHAQQWDGAVVQAARTRGWKVVSWTKAACSVADVPLIAMPLKRDYTECTQWRTDTIARIRALHPAVVFVSQSDAVPGRRYPADSWAARTLQTIADLRRKGITVVYIADTPLAASDVPACLAAHRGGISACQTPIAGVFGSGTARHLAIAAAMARARIRYLDPQQWLCTATDCPAVLGDVLVYRDSSHITQTLSRRLAPLFAPSLPVTPSKGPSR